MNFRGNTKLHYTLWRKQLRKAYSRSSGPLQMGYHFIHFDLRIAGFADLPSLPTCLAHQLRHLLDKIAKQQHHEKFKKEALGFKVLVD